MWAQEPWSGLHLQSNDHHQLMQSKLIRVANAKPAASDGAKKAIPAEEQHESVPGVGGSDYCRSEAVWCC